VFSDPIIEMTECVTMYFNYPTRTFAHPSPYDVQQMDGVKLWTHSTYNSVNCLKLWTHSTYNSLNCLKL